MMNPVDIRVECLRQAIHTAGVSPEQIVVQAQAYEAFVTGQKIEMAKKAKNSKK